MALTDVPPLPRSPWGIACLILNIIPGGVGSIIAGVQGKHQQTLIFGIVQLVLVVVPGIFLFYLGFIGWVWSAVWGVLIFVKSA